MNIKDKLKNTIQECRSIAYEEYEKINLIKSNLEDRLESYTEVFEELLNKYFIDIFNKFSILENIKFSILQSWDDDDIIFTNFSFNDGSTENDELKEELEVMLSDIPSNFFHKMDYVDKNIIVTKLNNNNIKIEANVHYN